MFKRYPETKYSYQHPQYPENLPVQTDGLMDFLSLDQCPSKDEIDRILSADHDVLREDLHNVILCELGKYHNSGNDLEWSPIIAHAILLLGECGNEGSLDVILEVLRQDSKFNDIVFADFGDDVFIPVLTKLAHNQLSVLLDFMKEKGLFSVFKSFVAANVAGIFITHPEKREEVIEWYRNLLQFYLEKITESYDYCDSELLGLLLCDILEIHAKELMPLVQKIYETNEVDYYFCGDFNEFCKQMEEESAPLPSEATDIYEDFKKFHETYY